MYRKLKHPTVSNHIFLILPQNAFPFTCFEYLESSALYCLQHDTLCNELGRGAQKNAGKQKVMWQPHTLLVSRQIFDSLANLVLSLLCFIII